jgi:DNA-binding transcriptional LysR family regulator
MAGAPDKIVDQAMRDIAAGARRDRHARLAPAGTPGALDPEIFNAVDDLLRRAVARDEHAVLLPELMDDDDGWRLETALRFSSHRPVVGPALVFAKRRFLLPLMRWLFDYSRENFRRQQRVNRILAAAIEELAAENARLKREMAELQDRRIAEGKSKDR